MRIEGDVNPYTPPSDSPTPHLSPWVLFGSMAGTAALGVCLCLLGLSVWQTWPWSGLGLTITLFHEILVTKWRSQ
jgi:hypothetical protein